MLKFGPCNNLATPPVTAAVVVTPALPSVAPPLQFTVAVLRRVSWWQYAWIPLVCGGGLAVLLAATMLAIGLPDSNADQKAPNVRGWRFLNRPMYAAAAWTFGGSWATNITAGGAVIAAALTATGTVSELLPGVELGRFSLLIAIAGGITVAAPLVFGALNYKFARVDPTTAGVSVIAVPRGPVAILRGRTLSTLLGWRISRYRYGGMVVFLRENTNVRPPGGDTVPVTHAKDQLHRGKRVTVMLGAQMVTVAGRGDVDWLHDRRAVLPDEGEWCPKATIAVPAGATITVSGGTTIPAQAAAAQPPALAPALVPPAPVPPALVRWLVGVVHGVQRFLRRYGHRLQDVRHKVQHLLMQVQERLIPAPPVRPPPAPVPPGVGPQDFTELPAQTNATLKSGAALSVPAGATITVSPTQPNAALPILALPGATDIAVFAGQRVKISPCVTMAAVDVTLPVTVPPPGYRLRQDQWISLPGGARISFLGRASLKLPAGTLVAAPGAPPAAAAPGALPQSPASRSYLKTTTVFPLPHTGQVIASQMGSLLVASFLTLFGTGAELGILGVLAFSLSSADFTVRVVCLATAALAAVVVWAYSVMAIMALADPRPGDALNATGGTSFIL